MEQGGEQDLRSWRMAWPDPCGINWATSAAAAG